MSDIHLGKMGVVSERGVGYLTVVFHVENPGKSDGTNKYPGGNSSLDAIELSAGEADKLAAGTLVEVVKKIKVNVNVNKNTTKARLRNLWPKINTEKQAELNSEYRYHGVKLTRGALL